MSATQWIGVVMVFTGLGYIGGWGWVPFIRSVWGK